MTGTELPPGVLIRDLAMHGDSRGKLCDLYRADWTPCDPFLQSNLVRSKGGVPRGACFVYHKEAA